MWEDEGEVVGEDGVVGETGAECEDGGGTTGETVGETGAENALSRVKNDFQDEGTLCI